MQFLTLYALQTVKSVVNNSARFIRSISDGHVHASRSTRLLGRNGWWQNHRMTRLHGSARWICRTTWLCGNILWIHWTTRLHSNVLWISGMTRLCGNLLWTSRTTPQLCGNTLGIRWKTVLWICRLTRFCSNILQIYRTTSPSLSLATASSCIAKNLSYGAFLRHRWPELNAQKPRAGKGVLEGDNECSLLVHYSTLRLKLFNSPNCQCQWVPSSLVKGMGLSSKQIFDALRNP